MRRRAEASTSTDAFDAYSHPAYPIGAFVFMIPPFLADPLLQRRASGRRAALQQLA